MHQTTETRFIYAAGAAGKSCALVYLMQPQEAAPLLLLLQRLNDQLSSLSLAASRIQPCDQLPVTCSLVRERTRQTHQVYTSTAALYNRQRPRQHVWGDLPSPPYSGHCGMCGHAPVQIHMHKMFQVKWCLPYINMHPRVPATVPMRGTLLYCCPCGGAASHSNCPT